MELAVRALNLPSESGHLVTYNVVWTNEVFTQPSYDLLVDSIEYSLRWDPPIACAGATLLIPG